MACILASPNTLHLFPAGILTSYEGWIPGKRKDMTLFHSCSRSLPAPRKGSTSHDVTSLCFTSYSIISTFRKVCISPHHLTRSIIDIHTPSQLVLHLNQSILSNSSATPIFLQWHLKTLNSNVLSSQAEVAVSDERSRNG